VNFQIFGPKLGVAENVPSIALREAFVQKGSENILERYGQYQKIRGRLADFYDITNSKEIALPTDVFVISAIDHANKKLTVTGDVLSGNTALADGDTIRINGGTTEANNIELTVNGTPTYSSPSSTVYVDETLSAEGATPGNLFVGTTPIIRYHRHVKEKDSTEYILVGTAYNIFLWNYTGRTFTVKHTCASACTRWEMVTHMDNVYATNNIDKVLWWNIEDSAGNNFVVLDDADEGLEYDNGNSKYITKAKHITSFERYLIIGYVTDSDGDVHPARVIGAAQESEGASIDFNYTDGSSDAWVKDFLNTPTGIMGFARWGNNIIVGTGPDYLGRIYRGWVTTEDTVFGWVEDISKVGVMSGDTFVNSKDGRLFFLATDMTIRELNNPEPISSLIDLTVRGINTSVSEYAQATFIDKYNSIALAVPTGSSETNNKLLMIDVDKRTWFIQDIAIRAFGDYTQQEVYTYNTLPFDTYDDWGAAWLIYDTEVNVLGFPLDICSDYSGYTYDLFRADKDAGSAITGTLIIGTSLDAKRATLHRFKRVNNGIDLYFNREAEGSVALEVKRNNEADWQPVGSASLADTDLPEIVVKHIPCDIRAKYFQFQLSSDDYFEFLGMSFSDFELEGTR